MGSIWQKWICVRWGQHALITIEVNLVRKCPPLLEGESVLVFLKKHLRLDITSRPSFHKQVIIVFHAVEHAGVICI